MKLHARLVRSVIRQHLVIPLKFPSTAGLHTHPPSILQLRPLHPSPSSLFASSHCYPWLVSTWPFPHRLTRGSSNLQIVLKPSPNIWQPKLGSNLLQSAEHPSPSLLFPSSQTSPSVNNNAPFPHLVSHIETKKETSSVQPNPVSIMHVEEHPSPLSVLLSSHCSPRLAWGKPLPHCGPVVEKHK